MTTHNITMLKTINEISGKYNRPVYIFEVIEHHNMDYTLCKDMKKHIKSCRNAGLIQMTERTALLGERYRLTDTGKEAIAGVI